MKKSFIPWSFLLVLVFSQGVISCSKKPETGPLISFQALPSDGSQINPVDLEGLPLESDNKGTGQEISQTTPADSEKSPISSQTGTSSSENPANESQTGKNSPSGSPAATSDIEKLKKVFEALPQRTKDGIKNGNPNEFLADLKEVLADDKDNLLMLCDKNHFLPDGYEPEDLILLSKTGEYNVEKKGIYLRSCVEPALREMGAAAVKEGITLLVSSTYRSYERQKVVYQRLVELDGQEEADRESAKPGTSQHQTGAVVDFGNIDSSYEETAPGKWLLKNAAKFGWSLSFPKGYEDATGYRYECWHYRYIGKKACRFQEKWFSDVQQFMLEFIDAWRKV